MTIKKNFKISLLLILILISFTSQKGVLPKINGAENQSSTNLVLMGNPVGRSIDYNTDGKIDVIWFDQQVNVITPGLVDANDFILKYSAKNMSGYTESKIIYYNTTFDEEIIFEFPEVGQTNFSFWLGSRTLLDFIEKTFKGTGWNASSFAWQPVLTPLYNNMTPVGVKIIGSEASLSFNEQADFDQSTQGIEIISPAIVKLSSQTFKQRNLNEEYIWSYNLQAGVGVPSIGYPIGLGFYISNIGTVTVNITGLMNPIIVKAKIDGGQWSDEIVSGYFYSDLFIPKHANSSTMFRVLHEPTAYWELIGNNYEDAIFRDYEYIGGNKFVGYNVSLNMTSGSTEVCWKSSSLYYLPSGILYSYRFDYIINGSVWGVSTLELTSPSIEPPNWLNTIITVSKTDLTTITEINTTTTNSITLETENNTFTPTTIQSSESSNGLSPRFSVIMIFLGFIAVLISRRRSKKKKML